jgi:hypothetical protein
VPIAVLLVVIALIAGVSGLIGSNGKTSLEVSEVINDQPCSTSYGSDVQQGGPVVVDGTNSSHIGTGSLGSGISGTGSDGSPDCTYKASVSIPTDQSTYYVSVGSLESVTVTHAQMVSYKWDIILSPNGGSDSSSAF